MANTAGAALPLQSVHLESIRQQLNMHPQKKNAIVMNSDPQILKGLVLLLEDMQFKVISARSSYDLEQLATTTADCPDLLLLPLVLADGKSGAELVKTLRAHFKQCIPAILLSPENDLTQTHLAEEAITMLSDRIKPRDLRRNLSDILSNELAL